jgi:type I restriction enzyme S subunit
MDPRYLAYVLQSDAFIDCVVARSVGVSYPAISPDDLGNIPIAVPPLEIQRTIADFLYVETARIDAVMEAKRRMVGLAEEAFRSNQIAHLTGAQHPDRCQHPLLGRLPRHWQAIRAKFCTGGITVGVVVEPSSYFVDSGVPFVHGTDVREGFIEQSDLKYLSVESNAALAKSQIRAGDVVAMRVGYPGRAAVVPPELDGANCASILIFRTSPALASPIVAEFLNSPLGRLQIEAVQYGAAQGVMNVSDAVNLVLPMPPRSEQPSLVRKLVQARERFDATTSLMNRQLELLVGRRQALITAAVTAQIPAPWAA